MPVAPSLRASASCRDLRRASLVPDADRSASLPGGRARGAAHAALAAWLLAACAGLLLAAGTAAAQSGTCTNLVTNPSFETDLTGWKSSGATLTRVSGGSVGSYSCLVTGPASTSSFYIEDSPRSVSSPVAGTTYHFAASVRSGASTGKAMIRIIEYVNGTKVGQLDSPAVTLSPNWQRLQVDYTALGTGSNLYFTVRDSPASPGEAFNVDDLSACTGTAPPPNQAPNGTISSPSGNVTIAAGQSVSFGGSGTDPDNNLPLTYAWNFGGGAPNSTLQNPGAVAFSTAGTYTVTFTVTDALGLADPTPDTRTITVTGTAPPPNQAPNGTISSPSGNVTIAAGQSVSFGGSGTDPDNNLPLTYAWNFGGGAANSTLQNPGAVVFATAGTYTVTFTVTDALGLADPTPDTRTVTVTSSGGTCTNLVTNPSFETNLTGWKGSSATLTRVSGGSVGSYSCLVTGPASTSSFDIEDSPRSVSSPVAGATYHFAASVRSGASTGKAVIRIIEYVNGTKVGQLDSPAVTLSPNWQRLQVDYTALGTGSNLYFTVRDSPASPGEAFNVDDLSACTGTAPPPNQAPNGTISSPSGNVTIAAGQSVSFGGSGTDPDNNLPLTYAWNFGGGAANSTLQNPGAVAFSTAGTYTVTFTVTDALGLADPTPDTRTITVTGTAPPPNQAPNGTISSPSGNVTITAGQSVSFGGSGTDPDNNLPLTYAWNFGGGAPNSTLQNPGAVVFSTAGTYTVTFTVTDALGLADPTPDTRTVTVTSSSPPPTGSVAVYVGYYDTHHSGYTQPKPNPWQGSSGVTFVGKADDSSNNWDSSCLRVDNLGSQAVSVVVTVDIGSKHFALWGSRSIPAGGKLVLAQTAFQNFDGSDTSPAGCYGCNPNLCLTKVVSTVPVVHVAIGSTTTNYYDNTQVLNTRGVDGAGCPYTGTRNDESQQWKQVGTTPSAAALAAENESGWMPRGFENQALALTPPVPNPARGMILLRFGMASHSPMQLAVYDLAGRLVRMCLDTELDGGVYEKAVDLAGVRPGMYYAELRTPTSAVHRSFVVTL